MDRDKLNNDLSYAVRTKHDISEISQLIKDGADVNFRARDSSAPLHNAAEFGYDKAAKVLLDSGADVNAHNMWKERPLHIAASCGHTDLVKLLAEYGADLDLTDKDDNTPLALAIIRGHKETIRALINWVRTSTEKTR